MAISQLCRFHSICIHRIRLLCSSNLLQGGLQSQDISPKIPTQFCRNQLFYGVGNHKVVIFRCSPNVFLGIFFVSSLCSTSLNRSECLLITSSRGIGSRIAFLGLRYRNVLSSLAILLSSSQNSYAILKPVAQLVNSLLTTRYGPRDTKTVGVASTPCSRNTTLVVITGR